MDTCVDTDGMTCRANFICGLEDIEASAGAKIDNSLALEVLPCDTIEDVVEKGR